MNKDVRGVNGQFITTWGRNLENDMWVGEEHPLTTILTCRCGKTIKYSDFPNDKINRSLGFINPIYEHGKLSEWFCSKKCVNKYEGDKVKLLIKDFYLQIFTILKEIYKWNVVRFKFWNNL